LNGEKVSMWCLAAISLVLWLVIIFMPLLVLFAQATFPADQLELGERFFGLMFRSFALAAVIAAVSVLLGYVPGRLLGTSRKGKDLLLLLLLMPLVLPRYVLYYAWTLLLSPTTDLGRYFSTNPELARFVGTFTSSMVLVLWYWPLASLLIGQGWRNIDRQIRDCACLDASNFQIFKKITLPLLGRSMCLAFGVCFVLLLSEFTTFHLAGIQTIGTELAVLYELTGSASGLIRAAWPVIIAAFIISSVLGKSTRSWDTASAPVGAIELKSLRWQWGIFFALVAVSLLVPISLLIGSVTNAYAFKTFLKLHIDELGWSLAIAVVAAVVSYLIAFGALLLEKLRKIGRILSIVVHTTIFLAMFVPASLAAVCLLKIMAICNLPVFLRQSWYIVSVGQAGRFSGVALIILILTRASHERQLSEMASLDGASWLKSWWYVHLPRTWRLFAGAFLLILMFSVTELSATMVLLPAGLPNFAQRLLNQMHYARDQQVIASCLILICLFLSLAAFFVLLLRGTRTRLYMPLVMFCIMTLALTGCSSKPNYTKEAKVIGAFGQTGKGPGEFIYPRAIDIASDGSLFIVDKTGRIQRLTADGDFLTEFQMPLIEAGKPTGLSFAPNGNLYVADTHYHRVVIFSAEGKIIGQFGKFGQDDGCFIYPTDVSFSGEGRIFVSEYGGNDRISVFSEKGDFLYCFGTPGNGPGQFSRPSALCVDGSRKHLYVADSCNHRIGIYNFEGKLLKYIGSIGREPGQLRYPYDLALLPDGCIAVCEYGNNRLQLFSPDGKSLGVYGGPGHQMGELAYPWGLAIDNKERVFIVDAGNNRIQVWKF
jgi:ABC-type Fe3+ transport system permease subunit/DNA-binding beta-propeller fold protein YncE